MAGITGHVLFDMRQSTGESLGSLFTKLVRLHAEMAGMEARHIELGIKLIIDE